MRSSNFLGRYFSTLEENRISVSHIFIATFEMQVIYDSHHGKFVDAPDFVVITYNSEFPKKLL